MANAQPHNARTKEPKPTSKPVNRRQTHQLLQLTTYNEPQTAPNTFWGVHRSFPYGRMKPAARVDYGRITKVRLRWKLALYLTMSAQGKRHAWRGALSAPYN
eukprot:scaffold644_cov126-Isochrysis_galbana.AAC.3